MLYVSKVIRASDKGSKATSIQTMKYSFLMLPSRILVKMELNTNCQSQLHQILISFCLGTPICLSRVWIREYTQIVDEFWQTSLWDIRLCNPVDEVQRNFSWIRRDRKMKSCEFAMKGGQNLQGFMWRSRRGKRGVRCRQVSFGLGFKF
ncbi:hypothetical protein O6H91_03G112500 [Diphasiastrum complanatum]|uniref:Uncharacterized protein n=1 Tax=Diphasiastrum complanatum TaxID=34168 RepID=A0ACC2EAJ7_DIPCM|nr:hypothetical protein O6H91_03G112500 [Diphasiastrum complanatum]